MIPVELLNKQLYLNMFLYLYEEKCIPFIYNFIILYYFILSYIILYIILYYLILLYIILYYFILFCIILYYFILSGVCGIA